MLNKNKSPCFFSSYDIPKRMIKEKISANDYSVRKYIKKGIQKKIKDEFDEEITVSVYCKDDSFIPNKDKSITLFTDHGPIVFYNYMLFFQSLTGFYLDESEENLKDSFPVLTSLIPNKIMDIFGFISLEESNDVEVELSLMLKAQSNDYTAVSCISSTHKVLMSLIDQPIWDRINSGVNGSEERIMPKFVPCSVGKSRMLLKEYKSLKKGDVIVLDEAYFDVDGVGLVPIGHRDATVLANEFTLERNGVSFLNWKYYDENL